MRKRFTEEQIVKILQEHPEGKTVGEVCRNNGISENTFYIWKRRYGGMQVSDVIKLKTLQSENERSSYSKAMFFNDRQGSVGRT